MNIVHIELVKTFNSLVKIYNERKGGVNYVDIRNLEAYIIGEGVNIAAVNKYLNTL